MWKWKPRPQPAPPTETQIQARARELWKARGGEGVSPGYDDRQQAIAQLTSESQMLAGMKQALDSFGNPADREFLLKLKQFRWERIKTVISAFGLAATIFAGVGLYLSYQNGQAEKQLNTERLITDRFSKAVEQLGSKEISVRIGGIYALERIAKDSPKDHWTVMEVLTAFVREHAPNPPLASERSKSKLLKDQAPEPPRIATDVQSALTAIGRRNVSKETADQQLDLSQNNLVGTDLYRANLQEASLYEANLQEASLYEANLQRAFLTKVNFQGAKLIRANLQEASLYEANLQRAFLYEANFRRVFLDKANFQGAVLDGANLQRASLRRANFQGAKLVRANLQQASLVSANFQGAFFKSTNLQGAILLATDFRGTKGLTQSQLEGAAPPLLCHVALPQAIKVNPNRDCDLLPQELLKLYPDDFPSLESARQQVDRARQQPWK